MKMLLFQLMIGCFFGGWLQTKSTMNPPPKMNYRVYLFLSEGCPMCQGYAGAINTLATEYMPKGVEFIGVFPNFYATDSAVLSFKKRYDIRFKLQRDPGFQLTRKFNAQITPQVFLTDNNNQILYSGMIDNAYYKAGKRRGVTSDFYLKKALELLLDHQPIVIKETQAIGCVIVKN
jgi:hypothetical protein